jgi:hypothetical protein
MQPALQRTFIFCAVAALAATAFSFDALGYCRGCVLNPPHSITTAQAQPQTAPATANRTRRNGVRRTVNQDVRSMAAEAVAAKALADSERATLAPTPGVAPADLPENFAAGAASSAIMSTCASEPRAKPNGTRSWSTGGNPCR